MTPGITSPPIVKLKGDGYVITAVAPCGFAIRQETSVQVIKAIYLVVVGGAEVGGGDVGEVGIISFRDIGT